MKNEKCFKKLFNLLKCQFQRIAREEEVNNIFQFIRDYFETLQFHIKKEKIICKVRTIFVKYLLIENYSTKLNNYAKYTVIRAMENS